MPRLAEFDVVHVGSFEDPVWVRKIRALDEGRQSSQSAMSGIASR
jgi:hypothetical protein